MTQEDIIRMAREAGMETHEHKGQVRIGSAVITGCDSTESVTRFATIVAGAARAAEREACAKVCEAAAKKMDDEGEGPTGYIAWVTDCAAAIRARGNK